MPLVFAAKRVVQSVQTLWRAKILNGQIQSAAGSGVPSIWKSIALVLVGVVSSGSVSWATYVRTAVTRDELNAAFPAAVAQYSPYTEDAANIKQQLAQLQVQNHELQNQVEDLKVEVAEISSHFGIDNSLVRPRSKK